MKYIKLFEEHIHETYLYYVVSLDYNPDELYVVCEVNENLIEDFENMLDHYSDITIFSYDIISSKLKDLEDYLKENQIEPLKFYTIDVEAEIESSINDIAHDFKNFNKK